MTDVRLNMAGLIEISNIANEKIAKPLADRIAATAGGSGDYSVRATDRTNVPGWGRTRVFTETPRAMQREIRDGTLARALGGL